MKHYLLFFAILLALPAWGQVPDVIPDDYQRKYKRIERKTERTIRKESPDIILDPIESLPIEPTFYAMDAGNWGPTYLGVNQRLDEIRSRAKRPVVVFIFDTGGCYDHPLLDGVAWNDLGRSFTGEPCADGHGHSTHVAGIIAAASPDQPLGVARMLPGIRLVPIKVLSNGGSGSFTGIVQGTRYANEEAERLIDEGYFVIYNYSLGGGSSYAPLDDAFKEAEALGVLINVAANGNTGNTPVSYPGRSEYTVGTAALAQSGGGVERASYSSYGPETWAAAPGSSILSTWPGGGLRILSGTSMATPHQAGLFAILASIYPEATAAELKAHFIKYATDLGSPGRDSYYGYGAGIVDGLLDNAPGEPEPDPPTCEDGIQNGKETGIDCGGPDCPPCEAPEEPDDYRRTVRKFYLSGNWSVSWWRSETNNAALEPAIYNLESVALVAPAGKTTIHIKEIGFEIDSRKRHNWNAETLEANVDRAFRNTGLGTGDVDSYDAAKWCGFIVDYFANNKPGYIPQDMKPTHLVAVVNGVTVTVAPEDLVDWKE